MSELTGFLGCAVRPMSEQETESMLHILLARQKRGTLVDDNIHADAMKNSQSYACMVGRLEWAGCMDRVDRDCCLFIASHCGIPGQLVMWALTFAVLAKRHGRCTFDSFIQAFPMGVPTADAMREAWDAQKNAENRNRVDLIEQWPQPIEKAEVRP